MKLKLSDIYAVEPVLACVRCRRTQIRSSAAKERCGRPANSLSLKQSGPFYPPLHPSGTKTNLLMQRHLTQANTSCRDSSKACSHR